MSGPRIVFVVGIVALAGACRDKSTGSQASAPQSGSGGPAAIAAPAAPTLPAPAPVPAGASGPSEVFAAQSRDSAWADATERELKQRIPALETAQLLSTECRRDQCMLELGGSEEDVAAILSRLESPTKGITGFAKSMTLTAPEQRDGKTIVRAYAQFER